MFNFAIKPISLESSHLLSHCWLCLIIYSASLLCLLNKSYSNSHGKKSIQPSVKVKKEKNHHGLQKKSKKKLVVAFSCIVSSKEKKILIHFGNRRKRIMQCSAKLTSIANSVEWLGFCNDVLLLGWSGLTRVYYWHLKSTVEIFVILLKEGPIVGS